MVAAVAADTTVEPAALVEVPAVREGAEMVAREGAATAVSPRSAAAEAPPSQTPVVAAVEAVANQAAVTDTAAAAVPELSSSATHSDQPGQAINVLRSSPRNNSLITIKRAHYDLS
jgi:hypothetical protein